MKKSITDDVVGIARNKYSEALTAAQAYLAPTGTATSTKTIDRQVARMTPQDVATIAQTNPQAAELAARRMEVIDARAATTAPYSDVTD